MAPLRFRAWDKRRKLMCYADPAEGYWQIADRGDWYLFDCEGMEVVSDGHGDLMQSTGLKDKNGVEIFEGDILHIWMQGTKQVMPEVVGWDQEYLTYTPWIDQHDPYYRITGCEVIGNIHENPELLEGLNG